MQSDPFPKGFVRLLHENEHVRASWVALLSTATLDDAESCLFSFHICLQHCAPDFWAAYDTLELRVWVRNTVLAYREGRYTNPFQPWEPKGRHRKDIEQEMAPVLHLIRVCDKTGRDPSKLNVAALLREPPSEEVEEAGETEDFYSMTRRWRKYGYTWRLVVQIARASEEEN